VREQRVILEDHADIASVRRDPAHVVAADRDRALVLKGKAGDHPERRRLAGTGRPEKREELALIHIQVDAVDGSRVLAEALDQTTQDEGVTARR
jgi:hypothetical protein